DGQFHTPWPGRSHQAAGSRPEWTFPEPSEAPDRPIEALADEEVEPYCRSTPVDYRMLHDERDALHPVPLPGAAGPYVLATGPSAAYRLRLLHALYGPGTRRVLLEAGLRSGMRVADLGCGVGMVTGLLAELVGPEGHVVGIDFSGAQLAEARERLKSG